jgi:hypothetical protein
MTEKHVCNFVLAGGWPGASRLRETWDDMSFVKSCDSRCFWATGLNRPRYDVLISGWNEKLVSNPYMDEDIFDLLMLLIGAAVDIMLPSVDCWNFIDLL